MMKIQYESSIPPPPGKLNTDLSLTTKIKTANFVGPKTRRSVDRVMHLDVIMVIGLLL